MTSVVDPSLRRSWVVPDFRTTWWSGKTRRWCVIVPVINEGERIAKLSERMFALDIPAAADIIIVDGGTTDGSLEPSALRRLGVRGLIVKTGQGKLSAQLRCGYAFALDAGYDGIVTIDGNDKDDPEAIGRFLEALDDGVDFVQASRFIAGGQGVNTPRSRHLAIRLLHAPILGCASGFPWTDTTQGFRAYSSRLLLDTNIAPFRAIFDSYE